MKRVYAYRDGELVEITPQEVKALPQVMDDVKEFQSPDGARISGRKQWREHLKRSDCVEMGHADIQSSQENWKKRREAFQAKVATAPQMGVTPAEAPTEIRETERSRVTAEVMNHLHNRPAPDRKTLIKLALQTERAMRRR